MAPVSLNWKKSSLLLQAQMYCLCPLHLSLSMLGVVIFLGVHHQLCRAGLIYPLCRMAEEIKKWLWSETGLGLNSSFTAAYQLC